MGSVRHGTVRANGPTDMKQNAEDSWVSRAIGMVKILMVTGDAGEAQEIYYAKFRLEEEGWQVQIAAPEKRVFLSVVHDFEPGFDTYTEKPGYRVTADLALDDVAPEEFDGLVLPGGRAPEYLRNRPKAVSIVRHFLEARKPIAANCHGRCCFWRPAVSSGRTMTCYPDLELDCGRPECGSSIVTWWSTARWSRSEVGRTTGRG